MLSKKKANIFRGLAALFGALLFVFIVGSVIAEEQKTYLDQALGTKSQSIETVEEEGVDLYTFKSDYDTTQEMVDADMALAVKVAQQGSVLLRNDENALPLSGDGLNVTLLGTVAYSPFLGGGIGSSASDNSGINSAYAQVGLVEALAEEGVSINPDMRNAYLNCGVSPTKVGFGPGTVMPSFGPVETESQYTINEASAAESVAQTLKALGEAEEGVKTVLAFAYDTERIFGTGESGEGLAGLIGSAAEGEGALANVSEREMFAWLDGVLAGFEEFGKSMTAEKIASVKAALASVRECFQGFAQPVEVVRDVMEWLRGAEELLGEVPFLTGAIAAATDVIYERGEDGGYTYDFVRRLKLLAEEEDGTLADINSYILAGEMILSFAEDYGAQAVKDELKQLAENGGEMTKLVIYAMALMFEASEQEGEDIEFTDDIAALAVALLTEVMGSATETAWNNYVSDPEKYQNRLRIFSGMVLGFAEVLNENIAAHGGTRVDINVTSDGPYTAEWYAEVVRIRRETIERAGAFTEGDALSSVAVGIIGEYVDKCYASLPDIERAVSAGWVEDAESEEAKLVTEMAANNPIFMLLAMFM